MDGLRGSFGRYEILGAIGEGGMGEVYVARDPQLGRKVAIKKLPVRLSNDRETLSRFTHEARSASALNHPNIVTIHEVGAHEGVPYIVMEYIEGTDLRSLIAEEGVPVRKVLDIGAQIADGLAAAHERGIVHRDLKPENIMITRDGFVKILDFGLAKTIASSADAEHTLELEMPGTNPGTILGTVGYMSPEQATAKRLDFRSDQFALGSILYEMTTGSPAFEAENAIDTLSAILHNAPTPIAKVKPQAPQQFSQIVHRLLEKSPDDRYSSPRDLARELRLLRDRVVAEESGFHKSAEIRAFHERYPFAAIVAAVGLAVFLAVVGYVAWKRVSKQAPTTTAATTTAVTSAPAPKKYLAVLRFSDLGRDESTQLVADGIAETLSARLARLPSIQLMRPEDSETLASTLASTNLEKVGRDLGVNLVLRGSMQRAEERLRVTYSIVDVRTRAQITGDTVDGTTDDLFALQDKLAQSIVTALDPKAVLTKVAPLDPRVSQTRYLEAMGRLRRYDDEESLAAAIATLEELNSGASSATIQAALGRAYQYKFVHTRDPELLRRASLYCERALASDPQNSEVRITLGQVRVRSGQAKEAIAVLSEALQLDPNNIEAILTLADAYSAAKNNAQAEATYTRAIALQPQYWAAYNRLGVFYLLNGRYPQSATMFEKVVQLVPDNLLGYNNLGAAYQQMGRYDDAIGMFLRTIERKPTTQALSNLGTCYYFLARYNDAVEAFNKCVEMKPGHYFYWANLGDAYRWAPGGRADAKRAFDRAIELARAEIRQNPNDARIRARLAECLAKRGDTEQAAQEIRRALALDNRRPAILYRAAVVAVIRQQPAEAISLLKQAVQAGYSKAEIQLDPEFASLRNDAGFRQIVSDGI